MVEQDERKHVERQSSSYFVKLANHTPCLLRKDRPLIDWSVLTQFMVTSYSLLPLL